MFLTWHILKCIKDVQQVSIMYVFFNYKKEGSQQSLTSPIMHAGKSATMLINFLIDLIWMS